MLEKIGTEGNIFISINVFIKKLYHHAHERSLLIIKHKRVN